MLPPSHKPSRFHGRSTYLHLLAIDDEKARRFYEEEALRGGWTVKQLKRQIDSQFYERTLLSKNKATMLRKGAKPQTGDVPTPEEKIKDPLVLEFLDLNYAREHWTHDGENPPVGLILCAQKDEAVAHYSLEGLPNKVMASEYRLAMPDEKVLAEQLVQTQRALEARGVIRAERKATATAKIKKKASKRSKVSRKQTKRKN